MIKSRYFPDRTRCLAEIPSGDDKIEIPADVYDKIADDLGENKNFILRGAYPYEAVRIVAESKNVEALEFDAASGEIKTSSTVGISAEMEFAFALWNFYDSKSAIERVILSRLETAEILPEILANGAGIIQIEDGLNIGKDFAKSFAKASATNSFGYVKNRIQTNKAAEGEISVGVSKVPQMFQAIKDSAVGDIFSALWNEIVFFGRHAKDIKDFFNGRISGKQLGKNAIITTIGVSGYGAGYALGGSVAAVAGLPAVLAFGAAFAVGYGAKLLYRKTAKNYMDRIITDDSAKMFDIFGRELLNILNGKFLTPYELGLLMEAIRDDITKKRLKDMYACGNDSARVLWARQYIERRLKDIYDQRILIEMPSAEDWLSGIRRVIDKLSHGDDIFADMERQRSEALSNMRIQLDKLRLKPYELGSVICTVNDVSRTQLRTERTMQGILTDNQRYEQIHRQQKEMQSLLDAELRKFLMP